MTQPVTPPVTTGPAPATPPSTPPTPPPTTVRRPIQPFVGGTTYTATAFEVSLQVDSTGRPGPIRVRFFDANGNPIPDGAINPVAQTDPQAGRTAVLAVLAVDANAGETLPQLALRAAAGYVTTMYGITLA